LHDLAAGELAGFVAGVNVVDGRLTGLKLLCAMVCLLVTLLNIELARKCLGHTRGRLEA
jgi:hypothetical protein